jgi:hypothetical protein
MNAQLTRSALVGMAILCAVFSGSAPAMADQDRDKDWQIRSDPGYFGDRDKDKDFGYRDKDKDKDKDFRHISYRHKDHDHDRDDCRSVSPSKPYQW